MNFPKELKYSKTHEWIRYEGDAAFIGISDYAQHALGDLVFVNLPELGDVESVKAVSDIFSPVSGTVLEINEELLDSPEKINEEPYEAWFVKVGDITETEELLDADAYEALAEEEEANA